jgi:hypothetical protein
MKLISIMILCTILFRGDLIAQDKQKIFYNTDQFFQTVEKDQNINASKLAGDLLQTFDNDRVFPVANTEFELFTKGALHVKSDLTGSLEVFFHIMTDYRYFDYSKFNQFKKRSLESTHKSKISNYKHSNTQLYVANHNISGEELGDYNFDDNCFTFKLSEGYITSSKLKHYSDSKKVPNNYEDNTYRIGYTPVNMPENLKIYPKNIALAEKIGRNGIEVKYIFALTEEVDEYKSFRDIPTMALNLYETQLYRVGKIGGDWTEYEQYNKLSTAQKIQAFYTFCRANNYSNRSPYNRRYYHSAQIKIIAIAVESSALGKTLWKTKDWYRTVSAVYVQDKLNEANRQHQDKLNEANRQQTILEMRQLSKVIWELNGEFDTHGPYYFYLNKVLTRDVPIASTTSALIRKDTELLERLDQIKFTDSRLRGLADKYYSGIEMHLKLNETFMNELYFKSKVIRYLDLFTGHNQYAKNKELRDKFLGDYWKEWFKINSDYFSPVEKEFGAFIKEHYPKFIELATPFAQCTDTYEQAAQIGVWLKEVSTQPTVLGLYRYIEYPKVSTVKVDVEDGIGDFGYGSIIIEIDGLPLTSRCDYYGALQNREKGDVITITYTSKDLSGNRYIQLVVK